MVERFVYGSYSNVDEAIAVANELVERGVPSSSIVVLGNDRSLEGYSSQYEAVHVDESNAVETDEGGFWNSLFGGSHKETEIPELSAHQDALTADGVLVVVDKTYQNDLVGSHEAQHAAAAGPATHAEVEDTESIKLHEESLRAQASEDAATSGDVHISKRTVEQDETVEVPVRKEEVNITHHKVNDDTAVDPDAFQDTASVDVNVSNEKVDVAKDVRVTDEVEIEKTSHVDTETVTGTTRKEVIDVEDENHLTE